jgi:RNA polymerase sigma factor (sigma-70 family)
MPTDEEWRSLIPQIERIARRVANRCNASPTVRDELADEAVGHIFRVYDKFNPAIANFSAWGDTVLRNLCVTLIRKEAARRRLADNVRQSLSSDGHVPQPGGPVRLPESEQAERAANEASVPRIDIVALLKRLPSPQDRLLLGAYQGVLSTCEAEAVNRWCRDANWDHAAALTALEELPRQQRKQAIAHIVGAKVDWVRQRIFRAVQRLKNDGTAGERA